MLPQIREAVFNQDEDALSELVAVADQADLNAAMFGCVLITSNPDMLAKLLEAGANIDSQDQHGRTALFLAVKYGRKAVVELLLDRKCDVQLAKFNGSTVLHLAAKKGDADMVEMLLNAGHSVNSKNWGGNTPLLIACRFGQKVVVNLLLNAGAALDEHNCLGHCAMHYACVQGNGDLVESLLRYGAAPDTCTHLGISPLMLACQRKSCHLVKILAGRASLNSREGLYGGAVIHWVVASGCLSCTTYVIGCGASLYLTDRSGRNALIQAIQSDKPSVLNLLLDLYKEVDFCPGGVNEISLHVACYLGRMECVQVLCGNQKSKHLLDHRDRFGSTALDMALTQGYNDVVHYLKQLKESRLTTSQGDRTCCQGDGDCSPADKTRCQGNSTCCQGDSTCCQGDITCCHGDSTCCQGDSTCCQGDSTCCQSVITKCISKATITEGDQSTSSHEELGKCNLSDSCPGTVGLHDIIQPLYKTYSPVKLAMLRMLRSVQGEQMMVADEKFDFNAWLDQGPEAFVLKVVSADITDWVYTMTHNPWSLRELCRGTLRLLLGYRACDKVDRLPLPPSVKEYLNLTELEDIDTTQIRIRNTETYQDIDIE